MAKPLDPDIRAIVRPRKALDHFNLAQWDPGPPLDRFVDRFWRTEWRLSAPFEQPVVTFPVVNLVFQSSGSATITGPRQGNDIRQLEGHGWALGVMFHPGGFQPFWDGVMADLVERRLPAKDVFGPAVDELTTSLLTTSLLTTSLLTTSLLTTPLLTTPRLTTSRIAGAPDHQQSPGSQIKLITRFLLARIPDAETAGERLTAVLAEARNATPSVTTVAQLARLHGVSVRTLQRLFRRHVGLGPKAVLDRYRLHAAAGQMNRTPATHAQDPTGTGSADSGVAADAVQSLADVAQHVGFSDQAHLTTAFAKSYGAPPGTYSRSEARQGTTSEE